MAGVALRGQRTGQGVRRNGDEAAPCAAALVAGPAAPSFGPVGPPACPAGAEGGDGQGPAAQPPPLLY